MKYSETITSNKNKIFCNSLNEKDYLSNANLDISIDKGFGLSYTKHKTNGGRYVLRNQLNSLGKVGSIFQYKRKNGVVPTFNSEFAELIGGYPKGAILWNINQVEAFRVVSLIDDNKVDFTKRGVDNVSWERLNTVSIDSTNIITDINKIFSYTGNLPGVQELGNGITEKNGMLILESYLKNFGTNIKFKISPFANWLSLYVSDVDIRGRAQKYCIQHSRFITSIFGDLDDTTNTVNVETRSYKKFAIIAKKGCYWSLWSNFSQYHTAYVYCNSSGAFFRAPVEVVGGTKIFSVPFAGQPFEGYINLYQG